MKNIKNNILDQMKKTKVFKFKSTAKEILNKFLSRERKYYGD